MPPSLGRALARAVPHTQRVARPPRPMCPPGAWLRPHRSQPATPGQNTATVSVCQAWPAERSCTASPGLGAGRLRSQTAPIAPKVENEGTGGRCPRPELTDGERDGILYRRLLVYQHIVNSSRCDPFGVSVTTRQQVMCLLHYNATVESRPPWRGTSCCRRWVSHGGPAMDAVRGSSEDTNPEQDLQREPVTTSGDWLLDRLKEGRLEHPHMIPHERFGLQADVKSLL
jgi:hypothetical protein